MKKFPILRTNETIDWDIIEPHREQAYLNHNQTLEQLASRGGLSWYELSCVILNKSHKDAPYNEDFDYRAHIISFIYDLKFPNVTFTEYIDKKSCESPDNIFSPPTSYKDALHFICKYLLGDDWYSVNPISQEQINTEMVHAILYKYSKEYRKEYDKWKKSVK